ncbi:hypothetical protein M405DRAFT_884646 [Rhizopogon salebrosus TDB-379]|nr:hypothetical protein M405DRAFT_884646 [Rhizopogon salebrosus TDB-379]
MSRPKRSASCCEGPQEEARCGPQARCCDAKKTRVMIYWSKPENHHINYIV